MDFKKSIFYMVLGLLPTKKNGYQLGGSNISTSCIS